jgi:flagellar assembly protein FliH
LRTALLRDQEQAATAARTAADRAVAALASAASQLLGATAPTLDECGDVVLEAALVLARAVLDAELSVVDAAAQAALRRALRPLPTGGVVTVRVNPADQATLEGVVTRTPNGELFEGQALHLVADPAVLRGDAVAERAGSVVDAGIGAALERALDVVRGSGRAS